MTSVQGALGESGGKFKAKFSGDCEQLQIRIEAQALTQQTGFRPRFLPGVDLRRPELLPWLQQVERIATSAPMIQNLQQHELSAVSMERLLVALLMTGQPWTDATRRAVHTAAPGCVRKAESFIEEHACEPLRLSDISAAAGVPPRTLHDGFRRFREYTPMQFLSVVRLERVRKRLQAATPETHVVSVAMEWGFVHLGRFARRYRERFGEEPSATLKRAVSR
jgi:transcriptional regulator GlxA family with amidase domain